MNDIRAVIEKPAEQLEDGIRVTLKADRIGLSDLEQMHQLTGRQLRVTIRPWREKRSLDANSYFHVLCGRLAEKLKMSTNRMKNILIADYGQPLILDDGRTATMESTIPEDWMMEQELLHTQCYEIDVLHDPVIYRYRVYRGSHTYSSKEMARLIDGTIDECKAQGIETLTPDQLAQMEGYRNDQTDGSAQARESVQDERSQSGA